MIFIDREEINVNYLNVNNIDPHEKDNAIVLITDLK
jgi:hypothetical protein